MLDRRFWVRHAGWPAFLFVFFAALAATTSLDEDVTRAWAFNPVTGHFLGDGAGKWWAENLIHSAGGHGIRILGALVILFWLGTLRFRALRRWSRPVGFLAVSALLGAGVVGLFKQTTNVDCPWALEDFGGQRPYVSLFGDRPDDLPRARCFPGAHSSSGFALFPLYFLCLGRHRRLAPWALAIALLAGGLFAFGQEARGAHFLSHDVWSGALVWFTCLGVYAFGYRGRVWEKPRED